MDYIELSKEVSYALRHAPWEYELELDEEGFVPVDQLLDALNDKTDYGRKVTRADLEHVIATSEKRRHELSGDSIRALYGHTTPQRILKRQAEPPTTLYHGTPHRSLPSIMEEGLLPMQRQYVHLSPDIATATRVGRRRDATPAILKVDAARAWADGVPFYVGNDKVWLADRIDPCYLSMLGE